MDQELFKALTVIMPVLDDYQADNIQDDTSVGLYEDREFTAAYKLVQERIASERTRNAAQELLQATISLLAIIEENRVLVLCEQKAINAACAAIKKATAE